LDNNLTSHLSYLSSYDLPIPIPANTTQSCSTLKEKYGIKCQLLGTGSHASTFVVRRPGDNKLFAVKEFKKRKQGQSEKEYLRSLMVEYSIGTLLVSVFFFR
jgi:hypothetical protein